MDIFVARQPILDRKKKLFAYELLFRGGTTNAMPDIDGDVATSKVLTDSFLSFSIDKLSATKKVFINFTQKLLVKQVPAMFPADRVVVEVLENVAPTPEVLSSCKALSKKGFTLALDDFYFQDELVPLIQLAHIIKVDFMLTPLNEIEALTEKLRQYPLTLLAEKVETHEVFEMALELGYTYFQGYFFSKPEVMQQKDISPSKLALLQIIGEINRSDYSPDRMEANIQGDLSISYKLLRYMNSAFFRRVNEITSIKQAIILLGEKELKRFVSLIATAQLASDKPAELTRTAIIRARFIEQIGENSKSTMDKTEFFTLGLFSTLDAMLDSPMDKIMQELPLSNPIKLALNQNQGPLAPYLQLAISYETGDWQTCTRCQTEINIDSQILPEYYMDAVKWAEAFQDV